MESDWEVGELGPVSTFALDQCDALAMHTDMQN
jgi:hypothetical protein